MDYYNRISRGQRPEPRAGVYSRDAPCGYVGLMESCWAQEPSLRPQFHRILACIRSMMDAGEGNPAVKGTFQVAGVSRALTSIAKICDNGDTVTFDKGKGVVQNSKGVNLCTFQRRLCLLVFLLFSGGSPHQGASACSETRLSTTRPEPKMAIVKNRKKRKESRGGNPLRNAFGGSENCTNAGRARCLWFSPKPIFPDSAKL